jgi:hypothetical protein
VIAWYVEKRVAAEDEVEHHPRGGGGEHDRAEHRGVEIADDRLEREENRSDRSVEGGSERGGTSDWNQ